jgi:geranylgeranyl reductase family protein
MDSCDILIVGGGPAGSSCAWGLRKSGLDVAVLDKANFPRDKVCGGWITPEVLNALEIDSSEYARGRVFQPITGFRVGRIGGSSLSVDYEKPVSWGIRRCEFDDYLLRRSGARLALNTSLNGLKHTPDGWIANDTIQARMVVGAGGHFCPVARLAGGKTTGESAVVAQETEFEMDAGQLGNCRVDGNAPELYFCPDMKGYGWCFRKGKFLNIGLGRADPHKLSSHVSVLLQFLKSTGRIGFDVPPMRGHAYLLQGSSTRTITDQNVLLIGDSAGLAYPQSGEGILPAIESGLVAAQAIAGRKGLETYRSWIAQRRSPMFLSVGSYLPSHLISLLAGGLLKTRWFVRNVVVNDWFLHGSFKPA